MNFAKRGLRHVTCIILVNPDWHKFCNEKIDIVDVWGEYKIIDIGMLRIVTIKITIYSIFLLIFLSFFSNNNVVFADPMCGDPTFCDQCGYDLCWTYTDCTDGWFNCIACSECGISGYTCNNPPSQDGDYCQSHLEPPGDNDPGDPEPPACECDSCREDYISTRCESVGTGCAQCITTCGLDQSLCAVEPSFCNQGGVCYDCLSSYCAAGGYVDPMSQCFQCRNTCELWPDSCDVTVPPGGYNSYDQTGRPGNPNLFEEFLQWMDDAFLSEAEVGAYLYNILFPLGIFVGIIAIILAGYSYMSSQGNPERVKDANDKLTSAILGILFIVLSLVILRIIIKSLIDPNF